MMTGFEPWTSRVESNSSANWATTIAPVPLANITIELASKFW